MGRSLLEVCTATSSARRLLILPAARLSLPLASGFCQRLEADLFATGLCAPSDQSAGLRDEAVAEPRRSPGAAGAHGGAAVGVEAYWCGRYSRRVSAQGDRAARGRVCRPARGRSTHPPSAPSASAPSGRAAARALCSIPTDKSGSPSSRVLDDVWCRASCSLGP